MELKGPKAPHPWEAQRMPSPPPINAGITILLAPTFPGCVGLGVVALAAHEQSAPMVPIARLLHVELARSLQSPGIPSRTRVRGPRGAGGAGGGLWCRVLGSPQCNGGHESGWPTPGFWGRGPMWLAPLASGGLALGEVTCGGWGPHLQYSFLINFFFFEPCANATGPSTGTCQHPTLQKHTDKHRITNV